MEPQIRLLLCGQPAFPSPSACPPAYTLPFSCSLSVSVSLKSTNKNKIKNKRTTVHAGTMNYHEQVVQFVRQTLSVAVSPEKLK